MLYRQRNIPGSSPRTCCIEGKEVVCLGLFLPLQQNGAGQRRKNREALGSCACLLCCCTETLTKCNLWREELFTLQIIVHHRGTPEQELKPRIWLQERKGRPLEECHTLASSGLTVNYHSYTVQDHLPGDGTTAVSWALLHQLAAKQMSPQPCPQANLMRTTPH